MSNFIWPHRKLELECKQILQNVITLSRIKKFLQLSQNIIIEFNKKQVKHEDKLNLTLDDPLTVVEVDEKNTIKNVASLFDNCDIKNIESLVGSIVIY